MRNYIIERPSDECWLIKEVATDQYVFTVKNGSTAKSICSKLNGGLGFDGWTPSFMLISQLPVLNGKNC